MQGTDVIGIRRGACEWSHGCRLHDFLREHFMFMTKML